MSLSMKPEEKNPQQQQQRKFKIDEKKQEEINHVKKAVLVIAIALAISLSISVISLYRTRYGDLSSSSSKNNNKKLERQKCTTCAGEELAYFAQRLRAEVDSEHVGLVQHDRVGGFSLQVQSNGIPANTSLVGVPLSSCISVSALRQQQRTEKQENQKEEPSFPQTSDLFDALDEFKKSKEFQKNKNTWYNQLGVSSSSSSNHQQEEDLVWEQIQLVSFLIQTRQLCKSETYEETIGVEEQKNNITSASTFYHWCPWMNNIVLPNSATFLPLSDFRWRPEVTSRCLRQSQRLQYEATLLQVSAMTNIVSNLFISDSASTDSDAGVVVIKSLAELRPLVEWALFILRTRGHRLPSSGSTVIVPLLDLNDKRVGAHLYRKSTRQHPTSAIIFDDAVGDSGTDPENAFFFDEKEGRNKKRSERKREPMAYIITTERHSKGAYPLTSPGTWSSTAPSSQPTSIMQNFGTVPHALSSQAQKKIFSSPINLKNEVENLFAAHHFFSVPINVNNNNNDGDDSGSKKETSTILLPEKCKEKGLSRLAFNISSGQLHPQHAACFDDGANNKNKKDTISKILQVASESSALSPQALFACRSVASKQKEGQITDKMKILGGKQAQALLDLDGMILKGAEKAMKRY